MFAKASTSFGGITPRWKLLVQILGCLQLIHKDLNIKVFKSKELTQTKTSDFPI